MLDDFHGTPSGSAMRIRLGEGAPNCESSHILDRFAQALRRKLDIIGLEMAPALNVGEVAAFREPSEVFRGSFLAVMRSLVNFLRMNGSRGMALLKRSNGG
jgi:hypothetical protein